MGNVYMESNQKKIKRYCENPTPELRDEIIVSNDKLVYFIARRYLSDKVELEELAQVGRVGLIKAFDTFDINKNISFSTYASKCIDNQILMFLRTINRHGSVVSLDEEIDEGITIGDMLESKEKGPEDLYDDGYLTVLVNQIEPKTRLIIELYYGFGRERKNQNEIGKITGLSQAYISRIIKRETKKIGEKYKKAISEEGVVLENKQTSLCTSTQQVNKTNKTVTQIKQQNNIGRELSSKSIFQNDYTKVIESLNSSEVMSYMSKEFNLNELFIISLKLGFVNGIYYSNESIIKKFDISSSEISELVARFLKLYEKQFCKSVNTDVLKYKRKSSKRLNN